MSLPLLSLPYVVLGKVTKQIGRRELFFLSVLSKRAKRLVASFKNKKVKLLFEDYCLLLLEDRKEKFIIHVHGPDDNNECSCSVIDQNRTSIQCEDKKLTFFQIFEHLLDVFHISEVNFVFNLVGMDSNDFRRIVRILNERNAHWTRVEVSSNPESHDKRLFVLLEECKSAGNIEKRYHPIKCSTIIFDDDPFNKNQLQEIFSRWMEGLRIEYLTVECEHGIFPEVFKGFPGAIPVIEPRIPGEVVEFEDAKFMIQQKNGRSAIVSKEGDDIILDTDF